MSGRSPCLKVANQSAKELFEEGKLQQLGIKMQHVEVGCNLPDNARATRDSLSFFNLNAR